jgi:uncharacterized NAD-dependent epimerase/dehydratase family protein
MDAAEYHRLVLLTEGALGVFTSKTAASVVRYRRNEVVAVLDSAVAGRALESILGFGAGIPIVASVADSVPFRPDALLIGIAPSGGQLPERMRRHVIDAVNAGLTIISGLHYRLRDDAELAALAASRGVRLWDVRDPGVTTRLSFGRARSMPVRKVLTVGTDCVVGKMVTCLELRAAAVRAGLDAAFVATGQTGIMIEGWGTSVDAVVSDFAGGATEALIERVANRQICFIEGQGSIEHPAYSAVSLALLHGACPDAMVMCHRPGRQYHNDKPDCPIAPIEEQIRLNEALVRPLHPARVVAVSINSAGMSEEEATRHMAETTERTGLPVADPVRFGVEPLLAAIRSHLGL